MLIPPSVAQAIRGVFGIHRELTVFEPPDRNVPLPEDAFKRPDEDAPQDRT